MRAEHLQRQRRWRVHCRPGRRRPMPPRPALSPTGSREDSAAVRPIWIASSAVLRARARTGQRHWSRVRREAVVADGANAVGVHDHLGPASPGHGEERPTTAELGQGRRDGEQIGPPLQHTRTWRCGVRGREITRAFRGTSRAHPSQSNGSVARGQSAGTASGIRARERHRPLLESRPERRFGGRCLRASRGLVGRRAISWNCRSRSPAHRATA